MLQIDLKKFLWLNKLKNTVPRAYVISDLKGEKIVGTFYKNQLQKTNQREFRVEKIVRIKAKNYMLNGKVTTVLLTAGLIEKTE